MKRMYLLALVMLLALGLACQAVPALAQMGEVLYLADTMGSNDGQSRLFQVEISGTDAVLTPLPSINGTLDPGIIPLNHIDVLAATSDGKKIYMIDDGPISTHQLAVLDVATSSLSIIGTVTGMDFSPGNVIDQGAISPIDGKYYVTSVVTDDLWVIDPTTAAATRLGDIKTSVGVDIQGGDIAFGADGTFYLWTNNANGSGAPKGLYTLTLPESPPADVIATYKGGSSAPNFTGLVVRDNGFGDLIGSSGSTDKIVVVDKGTGAILINYPMVLESAAFNHIYGDMSAGPLVSCTRTIGYWKNHDWKDQTVTILGFTIGEEEGMEILWNARGNVFSMFFAQLLAAKLNTGNLSGVPAITSAETFLNNILATYPNFFAGAVGDVPFNYCREFLNKAQKNGAAKIWSGLDDFNNLYECQ